MKGVDVEAIKRRGYVRTLVWWPFLLLQAIVFGADLLVKAGLHHWSFSAENIISAAARAVLTWLFFAALWRYLIRREQKKRSRPGS
ncbi:MULTISPECIES: hypothetical protein [unclassified Amycolatopsis]|uniref:hypothetical protein n=1 Tax=unclassified Amycolatopsis TaxID=2618356 RepID=UPI001FF1B1D4|nr:hypothetical protein [Amycolatopsis sp. FBCC-B4732]UOX86029.1 hypothetical protein MUY14_30205 [Amycolatopsis sp. FBCC-B4732]